MERGQSCLDGLIPLAFLLNDEQLIAKAHRWVGWTLAHQRADGAISPDPTRGKYAQAWQTTERWPNMVTLKVLTQYEEATGDTRVVPLMTRYLHYHLGRAEGTPLVRGAAHRWADQVLRVI